MNYNTLETFHLTFHEAYHNVRNLESPEKDILNF